MRTTQLLFPKMISLLSVSLLLLLNLGLSASSSSSCQEGLVLILGGTGNVGSLVTKKLLDDGKCVRIVTRNLEKAQEKFAEYLSEKNNNLEFVIGGLGGNKSINNNSENKSVIQRAFEPTSKTNNIEVSYVVFAAGGEGADHNQVNNHGLAECTEEAIRVGTVKSMVVISSAWVSKPYSLASLLFNAFYKDYPMARHLQGEDRMRKLILSSRSKMNYVILRAGRVVPDEVFPLITSNNLNNESNDDNDKNKNNEGLLLQQGDIFNFWGQAGLPGMSSSHLADATTAALLKVNGKYTVEITSGSNVPREDHHIHYYPQLRQDDYKNRIFVPYDDILRYHVQAVEDFQRVGLALCIATIILYLGLGGKKRLFKSLFMVSILYASACFVWYYTLAPKSVEDCAREEQPNNGR